MDWSVNDWQARYINPEHQKEFSESGIDLELATYCFESWEGTDNPEGLEEALYRLNIDTTRLQASECSISLPDARKINHLYYGGWWFRSFNDHYHLKPNNPRQYYKKRGNKQSSEFGGQSSELKLRGDSTNFQDNEGIRDTTFDLTPKITPNTEPLTPNSSNSVVKEVIVKYEAPHNTCPHILFPKYLPYSLAIKIADNEKLQNSFKETFSPCLRVVEGGEFLNWVKTNQIRIFLTEGIKKCLSILSCGFMAISLSAGIWGGTPNVKDEFGNKTGEELIPELQELCETPKEWVIAFDQDEKKRTQLAVNKARNRLIKHLRIANNKNQFKILKWGGQHKGIDDYLGNQKSPKEAFKNLLKSDTSYIEVNSLDYWWNSWHKNQDISPYRVQHGILVNQPYLDKNLIPNDRNLIFLKGNQGTGKTYLMAEIAHEMMRDGEKILVLAHRRKLGQAICEAMGIKWVDTEPEDNDYPCGTGICIDSLKPNGKINYKADDWVGCNLFSDEIVQFLRHLFNANTEVKKYRNQIIVRFKELLINAIAHGGKIFLADADLDCDTINFILSILKDIPNLKPWIVENTYQNANGIQAYFCQSKNEVINIACRQVSKNLPILFLIDGQKASTEWGSQTLETFFRANFPNKKILRYDGESVADKGSPANKIGVDFNKFKDFDIVILTNVLETGASIEIGEHFSGGNFLIANNVLEAKIYNQFLARDRSKVNRYCYASTSDYKDHTGKMGSFAFSARKIIEDSKKLFKAQIKAIDESDKFFSDNTSIEAEEFLPHSLNYWARQKARENLLRNNPRYSLEMLLKQKGWEVLPYEEQENDEVIKTEEEVKNGMKSAKNDNFNNYTSNVLQAQDITHSKYEELKKSDVKSPDERYSEIKHEVTQAYGNCSETTFEYHRKGKTKLHKRLYNFLRGNAKQRDERVLERYSEDQGYIYFEPDLSNQLFYYQLGLLDRMLDLKQYFDPNFTMTSNDQKAIEYIDDFFKISTRQKVVENKWGTSTVITETCSKALLVKELVGINFKEAECRQKGWLYVIQRILAKIFGVKMNFVRFDYGSTSSKRKQIREYKGIVLERDYSALAEAFSYWDDLPIVVEDDWENSKVS